MKLIVLLLTVTFVHGFLKNQEINLIDLENFEVKLEQLGETSLGQIISSLIELEQTIDSPVEELLKAVEQFLKEIENSKQQEIEKYSRYEGQNQDQIQFLTSTMEQIQLIMETAQNKIDVVIEPKIEQLTEGIDVRSKQIEQAIESFNEESEMRAYETLKFTKDMTNFDEGRKICQQCIDIFFENTQNNLPIALNQIVTIKRKLYKLNKNIFSEEDQFGPMIEVLVQMLEHSQQTSLDEEILKQLGELQEFIREQKQIEEENDQKKAEMWEERKNQLKKEISDMENYNDSDQQDLEVYKDENDIELTKIYEQQQELYGLQEAFENEQKINAKEKQTHEDLMQQYENDLGLIYQAKQLIITNQEELKQFNKK